MAERRMFAKTIIDSDAFVDMPLSTQALYFHLSMRADDDGFINNPRKIQRMIGASDDDLKVLIAKRFIIPFDSGIVVIKHWKIHNYIRNDRYKPTVYTEEKKLIETKGNGAYTEMDTIGIPNGYQMDTQVRLGKESIELGKDSVVEVNETDNGNRRQLNALKGSLGKGVVLLTDEQFEDLLDRLGFDAVNHYVPRLADFIIKNNASVPNHYATILKWYEEDTKPKPRKPKNKETSYDVDEVNKTSFEN